jgi:hypothetical protein
MEIPIIINILWEKDDEDLIEIDFTSHKEYVFRKKTDGFFETCNIEDVKSFLREKKLNDLL